MSASKPIVSPGTILAERYELTEEIGRGGFGMVYRARQLNMDRDVAIKILPPKFMAVSDVVERFKREARLASRLRHPNTITVHDYGSHENLLFIVMELLDGQDLADLLSHTPVIALGRILHIGRQVLKSLHEAHAHKIIHRDLKPENIFLTRVGGEEDFVKVLDFGIAKMTMPSTEGSTPARKLTMSGSTVGTPTYMSPEQAAGEDVDPLTDLYALAVIMYEMACGRPPFHADNPVKVMRSHLFEPVPPFAREPLRGSRFEAILLKALSKEKSDRFGSAQQFLNALEGSAADMLQPARSLEEPPTTEFVLPAPPDSSGPHLSGVPEFRAKRTTEGMQAQSKAGLGDADSRGSIPRHPQTPPHSLLSTGLPPPLAQTGLGQAGDDAIPFASLPTPAPSRVHEGASSSSLNQISALRDFGAPTSAPPPSGARPPRGFDSPTTISSIITVLEPAPPAPADEVILLTRKKDVTPPPETARPAAAIAPAPSGATQPAPSGATQPAPPAKSRPERKTFSDELNGSPSPAQGSDEKTWSWGGRDGLHSVHPDAVTHAQPPSSRRRMFVIFMIVVLILAAAGLYFGGLLDQL